MNSSDTKRSRSRIKIMLAGILAASFCWLANSVFLYGQTSSRLEEIEQKRADKNALLQSEQTSITTKMFDRLIDLGLIEESGYDPIKRGSSLRLKLGGMRSGSGQTLGLGYRYGGLWAKHLNLEGSVRGTWKKAFMFDFEIGLPGIHAGRGQLGLYARYENSPTIDYYGAGPDSRLDDRTSYRLEVFNLNLNGEYHLREHMHLGGFIGGYFSNVGRGQRPGVPSTEERFNPQAIPGLDEQADFLRTGVYFRFDTRDLKNGSRSGGSYGAQYTRYRDKTLDRYDFDSLEMTAEHYIPYRNRTRVVALYLGARISRTREGQSVPFYMQPYLGGSTFLRGFERYRFQDQNSLALTIEHRWHLYSGGFGALFFEAGKVAPEPSGLNLSGLEYSGGIGFRFAIRDEVVMRIDNAVSREGYRMIWTFSDLW